MGVLVGTPSGHIGMTIYAENLSFALILFVILSAISIGIKLFAPARKNRNILLQNACLNCLSNQEFPNTVFS